MNANRLRGTAIIPSFETDDEPIIRRFDPDGPNVQASGIQSKESAEAMRHALCGDVRTYDTHRRLESERVKNARRP